MGNVKQRQSAIEADRQNRSRRRRFLAALGVVVAAMTALALMVPAVSVTQENATQEQGFYQDNQQSTVVAEAEPVDVGVQDSGSNGGAADMPFAVNDVPQPQEADAAGVEPDDGAYEEGDYTEGGDAEVGDRDAVEGDDGADAEELEDKLATSASESAEGEVDGTSRSKLPAQKFKALFRDQHGEEVLSVNVEAPEGALPRGATMTVEEVSDEKILDAAKEKGAEKPGVEADRAQAIAVNITFRDADGEAIEPAKDVRVTLGARAVQQAVREAPSAESIALVHLDDKRLAEMAGVEKLSQIDSRHPVDADDAKRVANVVDSRKVNVDRDREEVVFEAAEFSVYALVYTVDFSYTPGDGDDGEGGDNGETPEAFVYSISGGGALSLKALLVELGIVSDDPETEEDELDAFVAGIEDVSFSTPEYLSVSKVETNTTVGVIKEALGLEPEYSAELTEEDIAAIDAMALSVPDWVLISLKPFTSQEWLIIAMDDGSQFMVKVTDGQQVTDYSEIDRGAYYIIYIENVETRYYYGRPYQYTQFYALNNDGQSVQVPNNDLDALGPEFYWLYDYDPNACWWYSDENDNYIEPEWSLVVGDDPGGRYLWVVNRQGGGFDIHGDYWAQNYLSWDANRGFFILPTYIGNNDVPIRIYMKEKLQFDFTCAVNNANYGSVSCDNLTTDLDKKNVTDIVATPNEDCYFVGWRLGEEVLPEEYGPTIPAGTLVFPQDNTVLTAIFGKNYTSPATQEINEWVDSLLGNPLEADKTAHVYDYDNRIYEIDLSASSSRYTIDQDIRIEFVTDISRSMYFPETLLNEQDLTVNDSVNLGQWLLDNGDPNEVYYVLADINNTATMYAVYWAGNDRYTRWNYCDASYYLPYDNASTSGRIRRVCEITAAGVTTIDVTNQVRSGSGNNGNLQTLTGKIYTAGPKPPKDTADWDRLSYLTAAVNAAARAIYQLDPGAEIGLVTFASAASGGTLYGINDQDAFTAALHAIQPTGGTNQTSAFNLINNSNPPIFTTDSGMRQVALLITDGAPQGTTWDAIERAATITEGNDVEIWTLGLALERVGDNKQKLMNLASDDGYAGNAENAEQLVVEVKNILNKMLVKATVIGEVYDTVDPAFYPVDSEGNPIRAGFYYADAVGGNVSWHASAPSDVKKAYYQWSDNNGTWTVSYFNQEIKWPEDGGWQESFYIKAKEDFMGGNAIATNSGFDNRVEANRIKHSNPPEGYYWMNQDHSSFRVDFDKPLVNVDELSMTENSTEWRVYLGTDVDPADELKKLWDKIRVNLVVENDGLNDQAFTIISGDKQYYSDALLNDAPAANGSSNETLPLSHFVNPDIIDGLIQQLDSTSLTSEVSRTYRYFPYEHDTVGTFDIVLTKTLTDEDAAIDHAPQKHETKEVGNEREVYTLTVTYNPANNGAADSYETTTPGKTAGKVADGYDGETGELIQSENVHKIHVFAKDLEITKQDMLEHNIDTAKFKLYRTARSETDEQTQQTTYEAGAEDLMVGSAAKKVVQIGDEMSTSGGIITVEDLPNSPDGTYYLLETEAPAGYNLLTEPVEMHLYLDDTYTHYLPPYGSVDAAFTEENPYNWTQSVNRFMYDSSEVGTGDAEKFVMTVKNNPGYELPSTGGPGTKALTIVGGILICLAGMLLWRKRRII